MVAAARELIAGLVSEPWGQISPSVYETGRLVTLAQWLTGHARRVEFLVATQRQDGSWGGPDGYALVPTLSATDAVLTTMRCADAGAWWGTDQRVGYARLADTANRGLRRLFDWLRGHANLPIPDTPAVEIIVPGLLTSLNQHLDRFHHSPLRGLDRWRGRGRLNLPAGMDYGLLATIRSSFEAGANVPDKLLHSLEVAGGAARGAYSVRPVPPGTVGASPAATAAWLGDRRPLGPDDSAIRYLEGVVSRHDGPVPSVIPITMFERAWVLSSLAGAGIDLTVPAELVACLKAALGETGTPGGAGLPTDADTTAVTLVTLAQLGASPELDSLWAYETETHFCAWHGERNPSTSVNAHVLEAFGNCMPSRPDPPSRYMATMDKLSAWLCDQQRADGSWVDKWHASPYYPTACCALTLDRFGRDGSIAAVRKAANWVLATQRTDGSWGQWHGTVEETAYAMQILLQTESVQGDRVEQAAARGYAYLLRSIDQQDDPPLWHDKDLYLPEAIVRGTALAALHLAQQSPAVVALARGL